MLTFAKYGNNGIPADEADDILTSQREYDYSGGSIPGLLYEEQKPGPNNSVSSRQYTYDISTAELGEVKDFRDKIVAYYYDDLGRLRQKDNAVPLSASIDNVRVLGTVYLIIVNWDGWNGAKLTVWNGPGHDN